MSQPIQILFATQTGNAESCADDLKKHLSENDIEASSMNMADANPASLKETGTVLIIASTWGEGEPPDDALPFYEDLSDLGEGSLSHLSFSICALGDTSYEIFCGFGKDLEKQLKACGASELHPRVDCDVDFDEPLKEWIEGVTGALQSASPAS